MKCVLVLQIPTPSLKFGHVISALTNPALVRHFCAAVLADAEQRVKDADDLGQGEFQRLRLDHLRVQSSWETGDY